MYESPIKMYKSDIKIQEQIEKQTADQLMLTVEQSIGFDVDKLELIKALQYDREQYTKGYRDCKSDMLDKVKQAREDIWKKAYEYSGSGNEVTQAYCDGFKDSLKILDKLIESEEQ